MQKTGIRDRRAYTFIEVVIAIGLFAFAFVSVFNMHSAGVKILDALRQTSRAEDIALANIEWLRTRNWDQLTNLNFTAQDSTNLIESTTFDGASATSAIPARINLVSSDPMRIGLKHGTRDIVIAPFPSTALSEPMRRITVVVSWDKLDGARRMTNGLTTLFTKGGMTADVNVY